jgi:hypothetical protein
MKTINHKDFRTSPMGGYAGVSSYERRRSGGLSRFGKDAIAIDFERMQKRIQNNDAVRGSPLVLRGKRFKLFLKCLEVLRVDERVANEERDNARHDGASETERSLRAAENVVHRRRRIRQFFLGHVGPMESGDSDGDSSAGDPESLDAIKDENFWPHRRHALYRDCMAHRLAIKRRAQGIEADFLHHAWVSLNHAYSKSTYTQVAN